MFVYCCCCCGKYNCWLGTDWATCWCICSVARMWFCQARGKQGKNFLGRFAYGDDPSREIHVLICPFSCASDREFWSAEAIYGTTCSSRSRLSRSSLLEKGLLSGSFTKSETWTNKLLSFRIILKKKSIEIHITAIDCLEYDYADNRGLVIKDFCCKEKITIILGLTFDMKLNHLIFYLMKKEINWNSTVFHSIECDVTIQKTKV